MINGIFFNTLESLIHGIVVEETWRLEALPPHRYMCIYCTGSISGLSVTTARQPADNLDRSLQVYGKLGKYICIPHGWVGPGRGGGWHRPIFIAGSTYWWWWVIQYPSLGGCTRENVLRPSSRGRLLSGGPYKYYQDIDIFNIYDDDDSYSIRHWTDVPPGDVWIDLGPGHFWRVMSSSYCSAIRLDGRKRSP